ncbi:MAG TPA: hypothetical protein VMH88_10790 [Gemmatimonadales bacterium]|nr:hypothetical protein [Gemmatimonadales bacterium]
MLYFENRSRDTSDAYLAEGLTEDIITRLGQVDRLAIQSSNSVRRFRGRAYEDLPAVGRALGVGNLVTGSVRRFDRHLRVTVELARAASGVHLWGDSYDRPDTDLFAIEEEIAGAVATAITGRLLASERTALTARPAVSGGAYDHFLRGNHFLAQRTAAAMGKAVDEYEAAIKAEPGFVEGYAGLAEAYALFLEWGWVRPGVPAESVLARGTAAAERALQLGPTSSNAWLAECYITSFSHPLDYADVLAAGRRAVTLDPRNAEAQHTYGTRLIEAGRDSEAVEAYQRALAIDPLRPITLALVGRREMMAHRFAAARRWVDSALAADPGFAPGYAFRARLFLLLGDAASARHDAETTDHLSTADPIQGATVMAMVLAREGDTSAARARLAGVLQARESSALLSARDGTWLASALISAGDTLRALDLLDRLKPSYKVWNLLRFPELDPIRGNPRFQRLVEESRPR